MKMLVKNKNINKIKRFCWMICNLLRLTKKIHVKMEVWVIISFLLFLKDEVELIFAYMLFFLYNFNKNNYLFLNYIFRNNFNFLYNLKIYFILLLGR